MFLGGALAATAQAAGDPSESAAAAEESHEEADSRANRARSTVVPSVTVLDTGLWTPMKYGASLGYLQDANKTYELDYLRGSLGLSFKGINLISFEETLVLARWRWYADMNSFNLSFAFGERRYTFDLGDDVFEDAPGVPFNTAYKVAEIRNWVVTSGIGNRWQFDQGFTLGVDWFELIVPIGQGQTHSRLYDAMEDSGAKRNLKRVFSVLRYGPTFNAFKVQLGWAF